MESLEAIATALCEMCQTFKQEGWWGSSQYTHCKDCHYTWATNTRQAHCTYCHRHFTSPTGFDDHLKTGTDGRSIFHLDPVSSKKQLSYIRNEQGAWYKPRPEDSYPHDPTRAVGDHLEAISTAPLDLDTREPSACPKSEPDFSWLPKSIS